MADETELGRVFLNLFENARRYGRSTDTGVAEVTVSAREDRALGHRQRARPGPGRGARKAGPPDHALLPRRRRAHRRHRRRPRAWPSSTRPCTAWAARWNWPTRPTAGWWRTCGSSGRSEQPGRSGHAGGERTQGRLVERFAREQLPRHSDPAFHGGAPEWRWSARRPTSRWHAALRRCAPASPGSPGSRRVPGPAGPGSAAAAPRRPRSPVVRPCRSA